MKRFFFILLLFVLSGCGLMRTLSGMEEPAVSYSDFHIDGFSFEGVDLLFNFDITNPNRRDIKVESFNYELFINEEPFLSERQQGGIEVKGRESRTIHLPVSMNFRQLYQAGRSIASRDSIRYQLDTEIEFDIPLLGSRKVPVRATGYLPVIQMPDISFDGLDVKQLRLTGAELEIGIRVKNPNSFGFSFSDIGYKLTVNNEQWMDATLENAIRIRANADAEINIPVRLGGAKLGAALLQILTGNQTFDYQLTGGGNLDVDLPYVRGTAFLPFDISGRHSLNN